MQVAVRKGCLVVEGTAIEALITREIRKVVGEIALQARVERDGENHHLTILSAKELKAVSQNGKDTVVQDAQASVDAGNFISLGLGSAANETSMTWFIVVVWPGLQSFRQTLDLNVKDFHVTVGFKGADIHEINKSVRTLVNDAQGYNVGTLNDMVAWGMKNEQREDVYSAVVHHSRFLNKQDGASVKARALLELARCKAQREDYGGASEEIAQALAIEESAKGFLLQGDIYWRMKTGRWSAAAVESYQLGARLAEEQGKLKLREQLLKRLTRALNAGAPLVADKVEKFPRTPHIFNLGAATRDDLILDKNDWKVFCDGESFEIRAEEKMDGANLGIFIDENWQIVTKNRSHYVCSETASQWAGLDKWIEAHRVELYDLLGQRFILFGEWLHAKHSIHYTSLPSHFMAFDLFDRLTNRFLSVKSRDTLLQKTKIPSTRTVYEGPLHLASLEEDLRRVVDETKSVYREGLMEGIVIRCDEKSAMDDVLTYQVRRSKLVRADFIQGIEEHWTRSTMVKNEIRPGQGIQARKSEKYPSTPHLPFSPCVQSDDIVMEDVGVAESRFCGDGVRVIVTEKLDGGNCCLKDGKVYGRTHSHEATHWSFGHVKTLYQGLLATHREIFEEEFPGVELFGENMSAVHSIFYDSLCSPFYLFAARTREGEWLSWDEVCLLAERLSLPTVPLAFDGVFGNLQQIEEFMKGEAKQLSRVSSELPGEGFVIRVAGRFPDDAFDRYVAKYVRANHVQTDANWKATCAKAEITKTLEEAQRDMRAPASANAIQLFVDLDGTLADFDRRVVELTGKTPEEMPTTAMWRAIQASTNFFGSLEWMDGAEAMWAELKQYNPTILSGVPMSSTRWAEKQKESWCAQKLGVHTPVILCATRDKGTYSGRNRILIDDRHRTKRKWEEHGGIFIHHKTPAQTLRELARVLKELQGKENASGSPGSSSSLSKGQDGADGAVAKNSSQKSGKASKQKPSAVVGGRCKYRLIVLVGFPGSGKSTFAQRLCESKTSCVRVCQDDISSRSAVEDAVGRLIKHNTVVVDRCNVTREERKYFLALSMVAKKQAVVIHFDVDSETCADRVSMRENHPTIRTKNVASISKIVNSFKTRLDVPDAKLEGFERAYRVTSFEEADWLLGQL